MVTLVHEDGYDTYHGFHLCQMYDIVEDPAHSIDVKPKKKKWGFLFPIISVKL